MQVYSLINTMFQSTKDKFQSISTSVKDIEKYVKDVKLNKDKYGNFWVKPVMENNMSPSISFKGRALTIPGKTSIKVNLTKVSPLLLAIYSKLEKVIDHDTLKKNDKTINNTRGEICIYFNNPKGVDLSKMNDVNISGEMSFRSMIVRDYLKITFDIKNVEIESVNERKYIGIDGKVFSAN